MVFHNAYLISLHTNKNQALNKGKNYTFDKYVHFFALFIVL